MYCANLRKIVNLCRSAEAYISRKLPSQWLPERVHKTRYTMTQMMKLRNLLVILVVLLLKAASISGSPATAFAPFTPVFEGSSVPDGAPATLLELESAFAAADHGWEPEATALPHLSLQQKPATPWDAFECACTIEPRDDK